MAIAALVTHIVIRLFARVGNQARITPILVTCSFALWVIAALVTQPFRLLVCTCVIAALAAIDQTRGIGIVMTTIP